ncbi:YbbR-like domain-containing protein [Brevibacillus fulvus]|uniref:YbbR domain-containing protein n=1 Tax=Brevibacillus fulvus TaxID=1125967 RepID=A0A938Y0W4_9BACL|nr:CdaR family protein [Brevibacillus fulvus]MBM7591311.1 YbbR domain-containing protein [Brevibacillus fulvus]
MDRWINSPWVARIIALLLASMMWMAVNLEAEPEAAMDSTQPVFIDGVKLEVYYDSDQFEVVKVPQTVKVALESNNPFYRHNFIPPDSYEVYVDLRGQGKGTHRVNVQYRGFPEEAKVGIIPNQVDVTLEEKKTVEKEVQVETLGQVAPGYTAGEPIVKPFRVLVKVPESRVDDIALVKATVNLDQATETIKTTVPLKVVDKAGNEIDKVEVNPLTVGVEVPVTSPFVKVPIKLNLVNELPDGYSLASVQMNTEEATVYGPKEVIDPAKLSTYPGPEIDLSKITSDHLVQLKMPLLDKIVKVDPDYLQVSLKVVKSSTKRLERVPIRVTGLSENTEARVLSADGKELSTIDFDVIGAAEILQQMKLDDVQVVADVSNLPPGVHEVALNYIYNQPDYLKTGPTALKTVTVEITNKQR